MAPKILQSQAALLWRLVDRQHGVVTRSQLLEHGYGTEAIRHRLASGRLHRVMPGVYAVGRPRLTTQGTLMAAVLGCGPGAVLSHGSAAAHWGILGAPSPRLEVTVPAHVSRRRPGIVVHRRLLADGERAERDGIPVTSPICTLIDVATRLGPARLEAAINEADRLDLADPESLRAALDAISPRPGTGVLRDTLDRLTFTRTDSELERLFLRLVRRAGLPEPETQSRVNGFRVDFYWRELGLVVETDGLRYHRTPAQQARDRARDQAHVAAGLTALRFTHAQVRYEPGHVLQTLALVVNRLDGPISVTPVPSAVRFG